MTTESAFRNSLLLIPALLTKNAARIAIALVGSQFVIERVSDPWSTLLQWLPLVIVAGYLLDPVGLILFKRASVGDEFALTTGWLTRVTSVCPVNSITAVQVDEPWYLRPYRLQAVTAVAQGAVSATYVLEGLTRGDAERLAALVERRSGPSDLPPAQSTETGPVPEPPEEESVPTLLYAASKRDLLATVLSSGAVFLAALSVVGLVDQGLEFLSVDADSLVPQSAVQWALLVGGVTVGATLAALLRFWGFVIEQIEDQTYRLSYGALDRTTHTITQGSLEAVHLIVTPIDAMLRRQRVVLSTATLRSSPLGRVQFPSVRADVAGELITAVMGARPAGSTAPATKGWVFLPLTALALVSIAIAPLPRPTWWWLVIQIVIAVALAAGLVRYLTGRLDFADTEHGAALTRIGLVRTTSFYAPQCVRSVLLRTMPRLRLGQLSVVLYANARAVWRWPVASRADFERLVRLHDSPLLRRGDATGD
jgi:uncharacterized membrane protein YdbT with pleckstrin-like domain